MSYDMIDRFLRNNLGDDDYEEYLEALDSLCQPPQRTWVGLTGEERSELVTLHHGWNEYGQAIEAKLKQKNT
jgi:hypothetical protein